MNFIDLFCGIGGFHQALKKLNAKCVWACDTDKNCREIYEMNYDIKPEKDIRNVDPLTIPNFDILCAGFPCQSFSNAGKKKCFKDKRGLLFDEIIRIASVKKPKFMFLENVKHIKKIDNGKVFNYIINEIKRIGYFVDEEKTIFELSPHELGIPQQRKRIIFVCIRNDIYDVKNIINLNIGNNKIDFSKILETDKTIIDKYKIPKKIEKILDIWDEMVKCFDVDQKMSPTILCKEFYNEYNNEDFVNLAKWRQDYILKNKPIYEKYKNKWDKWYNKYEDFLKQREIYTKLEWQAGKKKKNDSIYNYFIQLRQSGIRVKRTRYFPTLVAIVQTPIYGKEKRYITPRECARLQSFPDDFIISENDKIAYKQFGNAVNVDVIYKVIFETFNSYSLLKNGKIKE